LGEENENEEEVDDNIFLKEKSVKVLILAPTREIAN
jgi:hypothetical protein